MGEFTRGQRLALTLSLVVGIVGVILTSALFPGTLN